MNQKLLSIFSLLLLLSHVVFAAPETYVADVSHSAVQFKIGHFFSKVAGRFQKFSATLVVDREDWEKSTIKAEIDVSSVDTANAGRDKHLTGADYFDTAQYPKMTFESKSWKKNSNTEFEVTGDFTLHGVTKPVVLQVKSLGFGEGMKGAQLSGWEGKTKIKRSEFGMMSGTPAVGDEVEIEINIEAKKQ